jgi:uncharacterized membrane protein YgaE (UPF0421/DUF939 family)
MIMEIKLDEKSLVDAHLKLQKLQELYKEGWKLIRQKNFGSWKTPNVSRRCVLLLEKCVAE